MRYAIAFFLMVAVAQAEWSLPQVRYWAHQQGITNDTSGVIVSASDGIEGGWNASWGAKPTKAQVEAVDYATALAWTREKDNPTTPQNAQEVAWTNLIRSIGFSLPVKAGDTLAIAANLKAKVATAKAAKNAAIAAQDWGLAFAEQAKIDSLLETGSELTALGAALGARKYIIK